MNTVKIHAFKEMSLVDGEGVRFAIFFSGCSHNCEGCHNPESHDINNGVDYDIYDLIDKIKEVKDMHDGITLSGGDPFFQAVPLYAFLKALRQDPELRHLNIWVYTGYTLDQLRNSDSKRKSLRLLDVIVDGPYDKSLPAAKFRGSNNQIVYSRYGITSKFLKRVYTEDEKVKKDDKGK